MKSPCVSCEHENDNKAELFGPVCSSDCLRLGLYQKALKISDRTRVAPGPNQCWICRAPCEQTYCDRCIDKCTAEIELRNHQKFTSMAAMSIKKKRRKSSPRAYSYKTLHLRKIRKIYICEVCNKAIREIEELAVRHSRGTQRAHIDCLPLIKDRGITLDGRPIECCL